MSLFPGQHPLEARPLQASVWMLWSCTPPHHEAGLTVDLVPLTTFQGPGSRVALASSCPSSAKPTPQVPQAPTQVGTASSSPSTAWTSGCWGHMGVYRPGPPTLSSSLLGHPLLPTAHSVQSFLSSPWSESAGLAGASSLLKPSLVQRRASNYTARNWKHFSAAVAGASTSRLPTGARSCGLGCLPGGRRRH